MQFGYRQAGRLGLHGGQATQAWEPGEEVGSQFDRDSGLPPGFS
jgi:hypothetical protein